jgi:multisubunit Na+/H+ antiporter MnhB subunit
MMDWIQTDGNFQGRLVATVLLVLIVVVIRVLAARTITRSRSIPSEHRRRWLVNVRNVLLGILIFGLITVPAREIGRIEQAILRRFLTSFEMVPPPAEPNAAPSASG